MLFSRKPSQSRSDPSPASASSSKETEVQPTAPQAGGSDITDSVEGLRTQSFIDAWLTIVGDLHAEGDVRLDGRICGNVRCAQLIVGKDATITGAIIAEEVVVRGRIVGTIRAPVVVIQGTAHVESEIACGLLAIDDGAVFEGAVHRCDNPLAETEPAAQLEAPQRLTLADDGASGADTPADGVPDGRPADADSTSPASPPVANGHDTTEPSASPV